MVCEINTKVMNNFFIYSVPVCTGDKAGSH